MKALLPLAIVLALMAGAVQGAISTTFEFHSTQEIDGVTYTVCDMMVDTDTDWTNSRLDISLTSGAMYQHAFGSNSAPTPALVAAFPELAYDTFVTVPNGLDVTFAGAITMDATTIAASWADTATGNAGKWQVARITLTQDANGSVAGKSYDVESAGQGILFTDDWEIVEGWLCIPEPATLGLLAVGGMAVLRRRRR